MSRWARVSNRWVGGLGVSVQMSEQICAKEGGFCMIDWVAEWVWK